MPAHDDCAAEMRVVGIERGERAAFVGAKQALENCAALTVKIRLDTRPIDRIDAGGDVRSRNLAGDGFCGGFHERSLAEAAGLGHPISGDSFVIARSASDEAIQS